MKTDEAKHVKAIGPGIYQRAFVDALMFTRLDSHFIGMDKLRERIAECAALAATGYKGGFSLGASGEYMDAHGYEVCMKLYNDTIEALLARSKKKSKATV